MTNYRTTVCEALYQELEEQRAAGDFFEPGTHPSSIDTGAYLNEVLTMDLLTPEVMASAARELIRNAARDGKVVDAHIKTLDDFCVTNRIGLKEDPQKNT